MRYLLIAWLVFFSTGCSVTAKQPALHDFGLSAPAAIPQGRAAVNVNAPTWLWDNRIRYRLLFSSPSQIRFYGLDSWIASPPELFEQFLASSGIVQEYTLILKLNNFEQQFDGLEQARVVFNFSVEAYSSDKQKAGEREFYLQQPTKTADAAGAISGFTELAQKATEEIRGWIAELANRRK
jgi:cholesterol transport system auxiliary component